MNLTPNKQNKTFKPASVYTWRAEEANQIIVEILSVLTWAALDPSDGPQMVEALTAMMYTKTEIDGLLAGKEDIINKVLVLGEDSTNTEYPSAKAVYDLIKASRNGFFLGGFWYGKTTANFVAPTTGIEEGQNYYDFTTNYIYTFTGGAWVQGEHKNPVDTSLVWITKAFWDLAADSGKQGQAMYEADNTSWSYMPFNVGSGGEVGAPDMDTITLNGMGQLQVGSQSFEITEDSTPFASGATLTFKSFWQSILNKINSLISNQKKGIPDYANATTKDIPGNSQTWELAIEDQYVFVRLVGPYLNDFTAQVRDPLNLSVMYPVLSWFDDINGSTKGCGGMFFVPKGWEWNAPAENGYTAYIYPLI